MPSVEDREKTLGDWLEQIGPTDLETLRKEQLEKTRKMYEELAAVQPINNVTFEDLKSAFQTIDLMKELRNATDSSKTNRE